MNRVSSIFVKNIFYFIRVMFALLLKLPVCRNTKRHFKFVFSDPETLSCDMYYDLSFRNRNLVYLVQIERVLEVNS